MYTKSLNLVVLMALLSSAIAIPAKGSAAADKAAIEAEVGKPCTGENGTPVFGNSAGSCDCVSGAAVCEDGSGAVFQKRSAASDVL